MNTDTHTAQRQQIPLELVIGSSELPDMGAGNQN